MKKHQGKIGLSVVMLAGILLASGSSFAAPCPGPANPRSVKVSVGYADNFRGASFPRPFSGPPVAIFLGMGVGTPPGIFDAGAIKLDNPSDVPLTVDSVTVDIGTSTGINPWGTLTPICIPAKGIAVLTQTGGSFNFDTSELGPPGSCASPNTLVPLVHVTVGTNLNTKTFTFKDTRQVLTTGGRDKAVCAPAGNEGHRWVVINE
jgi:hypothetical protein